MTPEEIEKLLNEPDNGGNAMQADLAEALNEINNANKERNKRLLVGALNVMLADLNSAVQKVRSLRAQERAAKKKLDTVAEAVEAFKKTGNVKAYAKAVWPDEQGKTSRYAEDFIARFTLGN